MGDMGDDSRFMQDLKKERHEKWYRQNMLALQNSGIEFKRHVTACLFRENGKPKIDFYPHTGRWRTVGKNAKTFSGGAKTFLKWYSKQ